MKAVCKRVHRIPAWQCWVVLLILGFGGWSASVAQTQNNEQPGKLPVAQANIDESTQAETGSASELHFL